MSFEEKVEVIFALAAHRAPPASSYDRPSNLCCDIFRFKIACQASTSHKHYYGRAAPFA